MAKKTKTKAEESKPVTFGNALEARGSRPTSEEAPEVEETTEEELQAAATDEEDPALQGEGDESEAEEEADEESDEAEEESEGEELAEESEEASEEEAQEESEEEEKAKPKPSKKAKAEASEETADESKSVPLPALLSERKKRQAAEAELARLKGEGAGQTTTTTDSDPSVQVQQLKDHFDSKLTTVSINAARKSKPDFDEKAAAFVKQAETNQALWSLVEQAEDAGEAVYSMGEEILYQAKYGQTRDQQHKNLEKELRAKIREEERAAAEKGVKAKLKKKKSEPVNISKKRAAGGSTEAPYKGKSFGERLQR